MPRISNIEIMYRREQTTLSIRTTTKVEDLPMLIGESYGKMAAYLQESGEFLSFVPYVAYHNMNMQKLDVEIGFPVSKALTGKGEIQSGFIPEGKVIFCMYRGAYSEMEPIYREMSDWMEEHGFKPSGVAYEYYYNGPEYPRSELLTMIVMPIV